MKKRGDSVFLANPKVAEEVFLQKWFDEMDWCVYRWLKKTKPRTIEERGYKKIVI